MWITKKKHKRILEKVILSLQLNQDHRKELKGEAFGSYENPKKGYLYVRKRI